jgi:hypothetical protein
MMTAKYSPKTLEEELKNKVAKDFFGKFDCTGIIKKIDFSVKIKKTEQYLLWAEAKKNIIERRDLLVPQDVRECKGSFFTPKIWVELSQKYIADVFGEDWQDEYYVWDCAAGTGNLLAGLTNKYNIWASTLDKADVDVMHDRIKNGRGGRKRLFLRY